MYRADRMLPFINNRYAFKINERFLFNRTNIICNRETLAMTNIRNICTIRIDIGNNWIFLNILQLELGQIHISRIVHEGYFSVEANIFIYKSVQQSWSRKCSFVQQQILLNSPGQAQSELFMRMPYERVDVIILLMLTIVLSFTSTHIAYLTVRTQ